MGVVTGGGGGTFNGGTITNELVVDTGATTTQALELQGTRTGNVKTFGIDYPHQSIDVTSDGVLDVRSDDNMAVNFQGDSDSGASLTVKNAPTGQAVTLNVNNGSHALVEGTNANDGKTLLSLTGSVRFAVEADGTPRLRAHAAPADGALGAGECALWFDQTNGAAKLMVKAKQADGTVVTGSVSLA